MSNVCLASPPRPPPRRLAWDILFLVFSLLDRPSLLAVSTVSLEFLSASAPHLYRHVKIRTLKQLEALFCERESSSEPSRITLHLSLTQIQTLTLSFPSSSSSPGPCSSISLSPSRLPSPFTPLPLHSLSLSLPYTHRSLLDPLHTKLLPLLNPIKLSYIITNRPKEGLVWQRLLAPSSSLAGWTRIELVELKGVIPYLSGWKEEMLAGLPARSNPETEVRVRVHVRSCLELGQDGKRLLVVMQNSAGMFGFEERREEGGVLLVVNGEEERREMEGLVREVVLEKWRRIFGVEVEV